MSVIYLGIELPLCTHVGDSTLIKDKTIL